MKKYSNYIWVMISILFCGDAFCQSIFDSAVIAKVTIIPESIINTPNTEYAPVYYGDNIGYVYSSSRGRHIDKVIGESFHDLGYAAKDTSGRLALSASFSKEINSGFHEGPFCLAGDLIYFTRVVPTKIGNKKGYTRKIYEGDVYSDSIAPLPFATDLASVCHPTLSGDTYTMVFAGDMDESGHMDLFQSSYIGNTWSDPVPLVSGINTESHEFFPNFYQDSLLIFASDRLGGYGGYDLYVSAYRQGEWTEAELLPEPINSKWDDLGMILRADGKKGYFTSNRPGGEGRDDIYHFKSLKSILHKPVVPTKPVTYSVLDKLRFTPIKGATIKITQLILTQDKLDVNDYNVDLLPGSNGGELVLKLSPKKGAELPTKLSGTDGKLTTEILPNNNYIVTTEADGYETNTFVYNMETYGSSLDIVMEPKSTVPTKKDISTSSPIVKSTPVAKPAPILIPKVKGATIVFENIYYDRNSVAIQEGAAEELDALADALLLNPNMEVQLISHTDSRGESNYNLMLSEERALSAKQYLLDRGINPKRVKTRGSGEEQIRNRCKNNVKCSDDEHKYNRRTEVRILRI